ATRGRTIGHVLTSVRVTAARSGGRPGWRRALVRWLGLVPGVVANRFGGNFVHDRWSDTAVVCDPDLSACVSPGHEPRRALEQFAEQHPRRYLARVALIAAGGYAFLFVLAALQLGAAAALVIHALHGGGAMAYVAAFVLTMLGLT